ncbi:MAG: rhomboid family intramembrane serine protease [Pirellulales bacterium]|nr:rhomboid family intramembrane serine protease [Pirellulales bacterium]
MFLAAPTQVHDGSRQDSVPVANSILIALNVLLFFFGVVAPVGPGTGVASIFLYAFSHAGIAHLMVNMWVLWVVGNPVNRRIGNTYYTLGCLATIVSLGILARFFVGSYLVGSSGIVFAAIAALALLLPSTRTDIGYVVVFPLTLLVGLLSKPRHGVYWFIRWGNFQLRSWTFLFLIPILQLLGLIWWQWNWTNLGHLLGFITGIGLVLLLPKRVSMAGIERRARVFT